MAQKRIGIYAGTFDPVHSGHIAFALQAVEQAGLDELIFLPERKPRHKRGTEHFGHRVAMLRRAIAPHPKFTILELDDISFSVGRTLPGLRTRLGDARLVFLFGSDTVKELPEWPQAGRLTVQTELFIGCRGRDTPASLKSFIDSWAVTPEAYTILDSYAPQVSSTRIREALQKRRRVRGVLKSVERYSNQNWLYVSLAQPPSIDSA